MSTEKTVTVDGRSVTVVIDEGAAVAAGQQHSGSSRSALDVVGPLRSAPIKKRPTGAFHCALCDAYFWDSAAVAAHRASKRHRENSGEIKRERLLYKNDSEVTMQDVQELVRKKQQDKHVLSLAEILDSLSRKRQRPGSSV